MVELRWHPPSEVGDRGQVFYDINCFRPCNIDDDRVCAKEVCGSVVSYIPYKEKLNETQVMVTNLSSHVNYTFRIYARNRLSEWARRKHARVKENFATITVETIGSSKLRDALKKNRVVLPNPLNRYQEITTLIPLLLLFEKN